MIALLLAALLAADRPSEDELFGAPAAEATPAPDATPAAPASRPDREDAHQGPPAAAKPGDLGEKLARARDALDVGGQLYLRAFLFSRKGDPPAAWDATAPSLVDLYLDARPSDRVRAFALGRLQYDPTAVQQAPTGTAVAGDVASQPLPIPGALARKETDAFLDQLWVRWDVSRRVFVTAGKQHVKWGVGRFWNPTDFLHAVRRDPLAPFDARAGTTMVRVQVPWEERGWSFQAATVLQPLVPATDAAAPPAGKLGAVGGAARAEVVLGTAEVGVGGVVQKGRPGRFGADVSAGIWDLDLYGELALRSDPEIALWRAVPGADASLPLTSRFERRGGAWGNPAATAGASWTTKYGRDEDTATFGAEYFYNRDGYDDAKLYPLLLFENAFQPFYVGRHYAGAFALLPSPGRWDAATITASLLANLSDASWIARLDLAVTVLTWLRLETFGAVHGGSVGGELRLGLDVPPQNLGGGVTTPRVRAGAPMVDLGVAARVAL